MEMKRVQLTNGQELHIREAKPEDALAILLSPNQRRNRLSHIWSREFVISVEEEARFIERP